MQWEQCPTTYCVYGTCIVASAFKYVFIIIFAYLEYVVSIYLFKSCVMNTLLYRQHTVAQCGMSEYHAI